MKRIFNIFQILLAGVLIAACVKTEVGATKIDSDSQTIEFEATGAAEQTIEVTADGAWYIYAPSWLTVTPADGVGNTTVTVKASDNVDSYKEIAAPRKDNITIWSVADATVNIAVSQKGESGLDATRTFVKVTEAAQIDVAKKFLIVADDAGTLHAMSFMERNESKGDGYYSYVPAEKVNANEDGSISYSGNKLQYTFAVKGEGYTFCQSNGYYIYQNDDSYNTLYTTDKVETASTFTVAVQEDGTALLTDVSAGGKQFAWNKSYDNYGGYKSLDLSSQVVPALYIDQAAASTEVLRAAETVNVLSSATSCSIDVEANCKWSVRNHDEWVKTFTKAGENNGKIEVTFDANKTGEAREASFLIIGQEGNITVTLTQATPLTSIEALNEAVAAKAANYEFTAKDLVVSYVNGSNAFLEDETGGILLYLKNHGLKAGDKINGSFSGTATVYNDLNELTAFNKGEGCTVSDGTAPAPKELTLAQLNKDFKKYISTLVLIKDVEFETDVNSSSKAGSLKTADGSIPVYNKASFNVAKGSKGNLVCTPTVNKGTNQLNLWEPAHFESTFIGGVITVKATASVAVGATVALGATVNTGAALSYVSSDPSVATVSADGTVTGVKEGEATITITAPAGTGYGAAEATCKVTVTAASAAVTLTITDADVPTQYTKEEGHTITIGAYEFYDFQVAHFAYGDNIQFKKGVNAYIANKTALPRIKKISIVDQENGKTHPTLVVTAGTAEKPATEIPANGLEYDFSGGNYTFFMIKNGSATSYLKEIIIELF